MNSCYIIYSEKLKKHYIGACHEDLESRIAKHNSHDYGDHRYTAKADDWKLLLSIVCDSYPQAIRIEKHIKNMKSSIYINNLVKYPEMVIKLKEKYR